MYNTAKEELGLGDICGRNLRPQTLYLLRNKLKHAADRKPRLISFYLLIHSLSLVALEGG